jgi:sec-independent protein translocase protein TatA
MEGFGIEKLLLILVIVLVLFGARRVPEIGASIGKGIREFKRGMSELGGDADPPPQAPAELDSPRKSSSESADTSAPAPTRSEPKRLLGK